MIALGTSAGFTAILVMIWIAGLAAKGLNQSTVVADSNQEPSPISMMFDGIKQFGKNSGNQLASVNSAFNFLQSSTTSEYYNRPINGIVVASGTIAVGTSTGDITKDSSGVTSQTTDANYSDNTSSQSAFDSSY